MRRFLEHFLIWLPAILGGLFPLVVKFDHHLYKQGTIGVRGAIGIEFLYLIACAAAVFAAIGAALQLIQAKKWGHVISVIVSIVLCSIFIGVGFQNGAALLYAT